MRAERVMIPSARVSGAVELEGVLLLPDGDGPFPAAAVCHPHPMGGGEMGVPLVAAICDELASRGTAALRFNFGGVGGSGGSFTDGVEEPTDVFAALGFLKRFPAVSGGEPGLAGWSFGSWMALSALAAGLSARACVAVAPPLSAYDTAAQAVRLFESPGPRHYVIGERDRFCPVETLRRFAAAISPEDELNVTVLKGADHFLFGREREVADIVSEFLCRP